MKNKFMKTIALILLTCIGFIAAKAQNSRSVTVTNFSSIGVSNGIDLYLTQGASESLTIKGDSQLIKDVVVEQKNGSVSIRYKEGINWSRLFRNESIKVYVTFKKLNGLSASGGSDVYSQNTINTDVFSVSASGGSDVALAIACRDFQLNTSGGSDVKLKGRANNMNLQASGGSDVDAYEFAVDYAKVSTSGGSDANIYVNKGLEASANGGSDISYKGNAILKKTSNSKSGDIHHAG